VVELLTVGIMILGCLLAGTLARSPWGRKVNEKLDAVLLQMISGYAWVKGITGGIRDAATADRMIAAGANPKAVQVHVGHSSISVTMDRYTHLFPSDVDELVRRLEDVRARGLAAQLRPSDRSRGIDLGGR